VGRLAGSGGRSSWERVGSTKKGEGHGGGGRRKQEELVHWHTALHRLTVDKTVWQETVQLRIANMQFGLRWHAVGGVLRAVAGVGLSVSLGDGSWRSTDEEGHSLCLMR
jgi:hypothetical protein